MAETYQSAFCMSYSDRRRIMVVWATKKRKATTCLERARAHTQTHTHKHTHTHTQTHTEAFFHLRILLRLPPRSF